MLNLSTKLNKKRRIDIYVRKEGVHKKTSRRTSKRGNLSRVGMHSEMGRRDIGYRFVRTENKKEKPQLHLHEPESDQAQV